MGTMPEWKRRMAADPSCLADVEHEVEMAFLRGAGLVVAGLIAGVMKRPGFEEACEQTRQKYCIPLSRGQNRPLRIRLLGGLLVWVTSLYCAPRRGRNCPEEKVPGLHVELAQFGFGKGCSPEVQSRVSRQAAWCSSFRFAQEELAREGLKLNVKTVERITYQCGLGFLALRTYELMQWRLGELPAGEELAGKCVTVQIDGGRTKIRGDLRPAEPEPPRTNADGLEVGDRPGRSKPRPRQTFDAQWREPKLVTIFVHDEHGRMKKGTPALIDGTFLGPDAMAELVAMHLHRLGAARAASVTFVADGAPWIWDRLATIVRLAGLEGVAIREVLDCCHAAHHISLALAALAVGEPARTALYLSHRTLLRNGQWRRVVEELTGLAEMDAENEEARTEIAYLTKHGEAGRLQYPTFRKLGLPIGSGAIESGIRRVINLRLKNNGMFWREEHAEEMLQVRAQVISRRWDERVKTMRRHLRCDGRTDWQWEPRTMIART